MIIEKLAKLEEMTAKLPLFPEELGKGTAFKEYKMEAGKCYAWTLLRMDGMGFHRWYLSAGSKFPKHQHPEKVYFFVYQGLMNLHLEGITIKVRAGDNYYINPTVVHWADFPEETYFVTVTIPASKDFPS